MQLKAQNNPVNGKVVDAEGKSTERVSITVKGKNISSLSNDQGNFSIRANLGDTLVFSMTGKTTQEVVVTGREPIQVVLREANNNMQEVVVIGYGTKRREEVTGSISTVKGTELTIAPVANITNTLAGRLSGLISLQSSGQPGYDQAALSIRGFGSPLVIVDGIEADFTTLDPNTIESISVLKDASASIYGSRAGNGVILVTTKRGSNQKPIITVNSALTWQSITRMPKPVNAGQFAELTRETHLQSGQPESTVPFTKEQVEKYYAGTDPQYPNTNWYDIIFRDWAPQQQHNVSVRGGSENVKYYGFLGFLDQETMVKSGGSGYNRYNLISNIDAKISNQFSFLMNLNTNFEVRKYPWRGLDDNTNSAWDDYWNTRPIYPATLPDPTKLSWAVGSNTGGAHIMTNRDISGYNDYMDQNISGTMALNYKSTLINGLTAKALFNFNQDYGTNKNFTRPLNFYTYDYNADKYTLVGSLGSNASISQRETKARVLTGQFSIGYDAKFDRHQISVLGLHEIIDYYSNWLYVTRNNFLTPLVEEIFGGSTVGMTNNGSTSEMGRKSYIGRVSYNFDTKYLLDVNFRADASAKFPKARRWGYFPGVSLGWRINREAFFQKNRHFDELKLRVSYGTAGNDNIGNFQYLSGYRVADNIYQGMSYLIGSTAQPGIVSLGLANADLTWEQTNVYNAGLDFSLWRRKLYGTLDVFYRERNGMLATRINTFPSTFGANLPPENLNSLNNRGFELKLGTAGSTRDWNWDISGNLSWSRDKWMHYEEPDFTDVTDQRTKKRSGKWTDIVYGYKTDGLFTSQEEIDRLGYNQDQNPTRPNMSLRPGDIKYLDTNKDGIVDRKDVVELGKGTMPHWIVGLSTNVRYKQFDFAALFQGAMGYYTTISFYGAVQTDVVFHERWTPTNNVRDALVPRLGGKGYDRLSDYNFKKADYIRLKTVALGYSLKPTVITRLGFEQVRAYVAATNILTFDGLKKYQIDPEAPAVTAGHYYPQQKTISVGVNLSF